MAIDTENKRRSATGISGVFTVPPAPDELIDVADRRHISLLYAGLIIVPAVDVVEEWTDTEWVSTEQEWYDAGAGDDAMPGLAPWYRTYRVKFENRTMTVPYENRVSRPLHRSRGAK